MRKDCDVRLAVFYHQIDRILYVILKTVPHRKWVITAATVMALLTRLRSINRVTFPPLMADYRQRAGCLITK